MLVKQISVKTVYGDKEKILEAVMKDKTKEAFLARMFGVIEGYQKGKGRHQRVNRDTKEAEDTFWHRFGGDFRAVNDQGEIFESATAFLPEYVSGSFITTIDNNDEAVIEFAFDIYARYNKDSITSYEFIAQPVKKGDEGERMKAMEAELLKLPANAPKQIAASKK